MTISQDQFRTAIRDVANEVTERDVPPLSLPDDELAARRVARRLRDNNLRLLAPLAAAVAVIAVIATSVVLIGSHSPRSRSSASTAVPIHLGRDGVPPYYLATLGTRAEIRATATGATIASVRTPGPFRAMVAAGAAGYWTFVLAPYNTLPNPGAASVRYFLAQFNPVTARLTLRSLALANAPGASSLLGLALSPNGRELAIAAQAKAANGQFHADVRVYSLVSHRVKVWQATGLIFNPDAGLSWSGDGTLAFNFLNGSRTRPAGVWLLNTATGGGALFSDSRLAVAAHQPAGFGQAGDGVLTTNGKEVVAPESRNGSRTYTYEWRVFSAATGKLMQVRYPQTSGAENGQIPQIAWTGESGRVLVVAPAIGKVGFGVLRGTHFTPIPHTQMGLTEQLVF
jgi:hypothetical protein